MYKEFFELKRNPFEITPDPSFLFPTRRHNDALAALYYGVERRKGFVVLTGEVGTGKTLVVRCLLQMLHRNHIAYAYVFNSKLGPLDFLHYIASDLGLQADGKTKSELLMLLTNFLISRYEKGQTTVLVVDEAHHTSAEVLEEIRLLTNLETAKEKLLQILLVGQSELDEKLDSHELRQLKQRIALRSHLKFLSLQDATGYIQKRLQLASAPESVYMTLFPDDTIRAVYKYSRGYPRLINTICENALINAFARQVKPITVEVIEEVAEDLRLDAGQIVTPATSTTAAAVHEQLLQAENTLRQLQEAMKSARGPQPASGVEAVAGVIDANVKPGTLKQ